MKYLLSVFMLSAMATAQFIVPNTVTPGTTTATIVFQTCAASVAIVSYGTTTAYGTTTTDTSAVSMHSFPLSGLTPGTPYHYKIVSEDASGNMVTSPDHSFTTTAPVSSISITPSLSFLNATVGTTSAVQYATISAVSGAITITKGFTFSGSTEFAFGGSGTCKIGQILAQGQSCTAGVVFTATASGTHSGALNINDSAPGSPQPVVLTGTIKSVIPPPPSHSATLTWADPTPNENPAASITVLRGSTTIATLPASATTYTDSTVVAGQTYQYSVQIVGSDGQLSTPSNVAQAVIPTP